MAGKCSMKTGVAILQQQSSPSDPPKHLPTPNLADKCCQHVVSVQSRVSCVLETYVYQLSLSV